MRWQNTYPSFVINFFNFEPSSRRGGGALFRSYVYTSVCFRQSMGLDVCVFVDSMLYWFKSF